MLGLLGKKKGMTQFFNGKGDLVPSTVVELGPCTVVQKKTKDTDGYDALQLGFEIKRPKGVTKAMRGHFEKKGLPLYTHLKEFRTEKASEFNVGDELLVTGFKVGDIIDVRGRTKGRGFQGVMKRHGKHGGPGSHGSGFHRSPGSIGMRTSPARVFKNMKLPGHMGDENVTTSHLEVVGVRPEDNILIIRGAVPGCREGLLEIVLSKGLLEDRTELKKQSIQETQPDVDVTEEANTVAEGTQEEKVEEPKQEATPEKTEETKE